jgi:hypothetical protein
MARWPTTAVISGSELKLLVTSATGEDLIKARLPRRPPHPRALVTMLEGVALWSGEPLGVVISATDPLDDQFGSDAWHDAVWPMESPLVRLEFDLSPSRRRRRIQGVGNFRDARRQLRLVWSR